MYTAVGGGVGALYGPLHGGANEAVLRMLDRIKTVDNIPAFIEGVKARKEKLFGFGHRCDLIDDDDDEQSHFLKLSFGITDQTVQECIINSRTSAVGSG